MPRNLIYILLVFSLVLPGFVLAQGVDDGLMMGVSPAAAMAGAGLGAAATSAPSIFDGLMSVAGKSLAYIIFYINYMLGFIGGIVFAFGGFLLQVGLELNARLILSPIVQVGWQVTRDFANLGFVIAIIVIAFGTMLRLENYSVKKMLANLIMVALLVNFSLTFAGVFIDASNIVSNFFIQQVTPSGAGEINVFAENLAGAFQLQKLQKVKDITTDLPEFGGFGDFTASTLGLVASIFFVALFTSIGAVIMITIACLIIMRYVALSLLLILMPLAMLTYVFPKLNGNWKKWLKSFSDWLVFLPAMLFFLYLAILVVNRFGDNENLTRIIAASVEASSSDYLDQFLLTIADTLQIFTEMIVILGLLIGGLIASKSFSLQFSKGVINMGETGKNWLLNKAGRVATAPGRASGRWTGRRLLESEAVKDIASGLSRVPGFKRVGSALSNRITSSKELTKQEVDNYRKKYLNNLPNSKDVHSYTKSRLIPEALMPVARAAEISELAERGKIDEVLSSVPIKKRYSVVGQWLKSAKTAGIEKEIIKAKPDWAPRIGESIEKTVRKIEDVNKISRNSFGSAAVVSALTQDQLNKVQGSVKKTIKETMEKELERIKHETSLTDKELESFVKESGKELKNLAKTQGQTVEQFVAMREQTINQLKTNKKISDSDFVRLKSLVNLRRTAINNPSWQI